MTEDQLLIYAASFGPSVRITTERFPASCALVEKKLATVENGGLTVTEKGRERALELLSPLGVSMSSRGPSK